MKTRQIADSPNGACHQIVIEDGGAATLTIDGVFIWTFTRASEAREASRKLMGDEYGFPGIGMPAWRSCPA